MHSDFWIGDHVLLKKSGRKGIINGFTEEGKVIVIIDDKKVISTKANIQLAEEDKFVFPDWVFEKTEYKVVIDQKVKISDTIDLHMEVLAPTRKNDPPQVIFDFQVRKAMEFIQKAYGLKHPFVKIICGKGQGVLRGYLMEILRRDVMIKLITEQHDGGALDVWLNIK